MPGKTSYFEFSKYFRIERLVNDLFNGIFDELNEIVVFLLNGQSVEIKNFNADFALTVSDFEGKVIWHNNNFSAMTGYSSKEILGRRVRNAMYGKKSIRIDKNYVDENLKNGVPFYFENIGYKKSGIEYWFGVVVFPIYNTRKELFGRLHCISDITEKKTMFLTAMKNEAVINLAIENNDTVFWSFDVSDQQFTLSDKQRSILLPEFVLEIEKAIINIISNLSFSVDESKTLINNVEIETNDKRFQKRIFDVMITCIERDSNTRPVQYVGALHDVTIRHNQYKELLEKNIELEKLNANLDSFVYGASHNLRSPLTSIKGIVDILLTQQLPPDDNLYFLSEINRSIDKLDATIFDIIEHARNTRTDIDASQIDIENIVRTSFNDNRYYSQLSIQFTVSLHITCPFFSDRRLVTSVLDNIVSNAIKYSDENKSHSYIAVSIAVNEQQCVIRIEDNGIGMTDDNLKKAFKMFYRGTNKTSGSGLGLFMVKEILDKIGGSIDMHSEFGIGTTTSITLKNIK